MSYTPNVPTASPRQSLNQARPIINTNFTLIQTAFGQDHIDFNAAGAGKHTAVHFPAAANATQSATGIGELALYSKLDGSGVPRLTMREPSPSPSSPGSERQISGKVFSQKGALTNGGAVPLFGGFLLLYGQVNLAAVSVNVLFLNECGTALSTCFCVIPTLNSTVGAISVSNISPTGFTATSPGGIVMNFIAIGLP